MWRLRSHLTACIASGRIILLDERADRYFAVPGKGTAPVSRWLEAGDGSAAPDILETLIGPPQAHGLSNRHRILATAPAPDFAQEQTSIAGTGLVLGVAASVSAAWFAIRARNLCAILDSRRRQRQTGAAAGPDDLHHCARLFARARRWCPIPPNCLLDSLALDRWLGSPSDIEIVFGVVGQPFEAHCWVQSGSDVLNDSYDRVSRFEPILLV